MLWIAPEKKASSTGDISSVVVTGGSILVLPFGNLTLCDTGRSVLRDTRYNRAGGGEAIHITPLNTPTNVTV